MLPARRAEATVSVRRDGSADAGRRGGRPATAAEDWLRIREVLRAALEKDPGQRSAFLDDACAGDAALRQSVDALLAAHEEARGHPEELAREASAAYGYPAGFLARYFEKLRYRFGPRERAGLLTFFELARDAGELERVPELRFVATEAVTA